MSETMLTKLKLIKDYRFNVEFDVEGVPNLVVDEPKPVGEGVGPNPERLLSAAVGHCLSSSLLYCLHKARVKVRNLETNVKANTWRNEQGHLRVRNIEVQMQLGVQKEDKVRVSRCLKIFENYCTVTQSVRKGIDVNVNVDVKP